MFTPSTTPSVVSVRAMGAHLFTPKRFSTTSIHRQTWNLQRLHHPTPIYQGRLCLQQRLFSTTPRHSAAHVSTPESSPSNSQKSNTSESSLQTNTQPQRSLLSRFLPTSFLKGDTAKSASSFRKIVSLAKPERKPLGIAIGLLFISSSVSMSVPFTIGKLIDYFSSTTPVSLLAVLLFSRVAHFLI